MSLGLAAVLGLGLEEHLPLAPEAVEVVHVGAAHEGLERGVDRAQVDALLERLVAVHVGEDLRHRGAERAEHALELGPLARGLEEALRVFSARNSTGPPLRSWSIIEKPPPVPMPGMAGGRNAKTCAAGIDANSPVQRGEDAP